MEEWGRGNRRGGGVSLDFPDASRFPDEQAAFMLDQRVRSLDILCRTAFVQLGFLCQEVQTRSLWRCLGQESFTAWILDAAPYSYSYCHEAKRVLGELADVPKHDLLEMSRGNLYELRKLSTAVRKDPAVIRAAKTLNPTAFTEFMEHEHTDQHIEGVRRMTFVLPQSAYSVVEGVIEAAIASGQCGSKEDWLEAVCAELMTPC